MKRTMLILAVLLVAGAVQAQKVVKTFSGNGTSTTRPFTVKDGWEIQWNLKNGLLLQILVEQEGKKAFDLASNQGKVGKGSAYRPKGGTYYLSINAAGDWEIKIVQVRR